MLVCVHARVCVGTPHISSCDPGVDCEREFAGMSTLRDKLASLVEACFSIRDYDRNFSERQSWHLLLMLL